MDIYPLLPEKPDVLARSILVGDCEVDEDRDVVLGISVNWKWDVFVNGKLVCDARGCSNGESTFEPSDHLVRCRLKRGKNQIACELFNGRGQFQIALNVFDEIPPELKWKPFAHFPNTDGSRVTISFSTTDICPGGVIYRPVGSKEWQTKYDTRGGQIRRDVSVHNIRLSRLLPDTDYEYRVFILDEPDAWARRLLGKVETFHSPKSAHQSISFIATADIQIAPGKRSAWMKKLFARDYAKRADFFTFVGDVSWTSDFSKEYMANFIEPFQKITKNRKMLDIVRGNHEYYGKDTQSFFKVFSAPEPGKEGYYMFRYGDVCFFALDFGDDEGRCPAPSTRALHCIGDYLDEQKEWLAKAIETPACKTAKYRVVLAHGLPYGDWQEYMTGKVRYVIDDFFAGRKPKCKIHLWVGGHVHYAFRTTPWKDDYRSIVPAATIYNKRIDKPMNFQPIGHKYGFPITVFSGPSGYNTPDFQLSDISVNITPKALTVIAHDMEGNEYDRFSITPDGKFSEIACSENFKFNGIGSCPIIPNTPFAR